VHLPVFKEAIPQLLRENRVVVNRAKDGVFMLPCQLDRTKDLRPISGNREMCEGLSILGAILTPNKQWLMACRAGSRRPRPLGRASIGRAKLPSILWNGYWQTCYGVSRYLHSQTLFSDKFWRASYDGDVKSRREDFWRMIGRAGHVEHVGQRRAV
jgi:hypothetical protein